MLLQAAQTHIPSVCAAPVAPSGVIKGTYRHFRSEERVAKARVGAQRSHSGGGGAGAAQCNICDGVWPLQTPHPPTSGSTPLRPSQAGASKPGLIFAKAFVAHPRSGAPPQTFLSVLLRARSRQQLSPGRGGCPRSAYSEASSRRNITLQLLAILYQTGWDVEKIRLEECPPPFFFITLPVLQASTKKGYRHVCSCVRGKTPRRSCGLLRGRTETMSWGSELWVSVRDFIASVHLTVFGEPIHIADSTFAAKRGSSCAPLGARWLPATSLILSFDRHWIS